MIDLESVTAYRDRVLISNLPDYTIVWSHSMFVVGIDLSGPSNIKDTALVYFKMKSGELKLTGS